LVVGADGKITRSAHVFVGAGGGVDAVHIEPQQIGPSATPDPSRWSWVPNASALATVRVSIHASLELELGLAVDVDLVHSSYYAADPSAGTRSVVLAPRLVRPGWQLGVAF
jgi:hypothetical protein